MGNLKSMEVIMKSMKLNLDHSMWSMMFYDWTNAGYDMGDTLNPETFSIYANIVCSGTWSWMRYLGY